MDGLEPTEVCKVPLPFFSPVLGRPN